MPSALKYDSLTTIIVPTGTLVAGGVALSFRRKAVGDSHLVRRQADSGGGLLHTRDGLQVRSSSR